MTREPTRAAARRTRWAVLATLVVAGAALIGVVEHRPSASSTSSFRPPIVAEHLAQRPQPSRQGNFSAPPGERVPGDPLGPAGGADGVIPDGVDVTVFDDQYPAVSKLDPALVRALRQAAADAARVGVKFYVDTGWRSPTYQQQLLDEAIVKYGSKAEAARWVATPTTSAHVSGKAVDLGHSDATAWLSRHGAQFGLCQIYRNEPWHYELRPAAVDHGCPPMYADAAHDPRMQQ